METNRNILDIRKRQLTFWGHVMRKEGLENLVLTGKIEGQKKIVRNILHGLE